MKLRVFRPAAFFLCAVLLGCGGAEERKAEHLAKAIEFFDAKNFDKASIEFKNVLQIDPKAAKPYYYLGQIEESRKNWGQAFGLFQKAVELEPNFRDAQFKLAQFLLLARDPDKAEETLAPVAKEKPTDVEVRMLQAAIKKVKGDAATAVANLESIVAEKPQKADPYIVLAAFYGEQKKPADAERALRLGLEAIPKSPTLLASLGRFYENQKQWDKAEQTLQQLVASDTQQFQFRVMLTDIYLKQNKSAAAQETLLKAKADFPENPQPLLMIAEFFSRGGDQNRAISELKSGISASPKVFPLSAALAGLLEKGGKAEEAEQVLKDFVAKNEDSPDAVKAEVALAEVLARRGKKAESEKLVDKVLTDTPKDYPALLLKGKLALDRKNAQDAISAFRSILKDQPDSAEVLGLLAAAFQLDGKPALVQEQLDKAVLAKPDDAGLRRNLVQHLIRQNNLPQALDQANAFLKLQPDSFEGLNIKAEVLEASNRIDELEALLKELKQKFPDKPITAYRLGKLYQHQKKFDAALSEYEAAAAKAGVDYEVLKAIATVFLELKQPEKAEARLRKAATDDPKQPGVQQLLGALEVVRGNGEAAIASYQKAIEASPKWLLPYMELAQYYQSQEDSERAVSVLRRAQQAVPESFQPVAALAGVLEKGEKLEEAEKIYRDYLVANENKPEAGRARNMLADLMARTGRSKEAAALLDSSLAKNPRDLGALLYKAKLALADKRTKDAIGALQTALEDQPESVEALTLLASAYQAEGLADQVLLTLQKAVAARPEEFSVRRNLVQFLMQQKKSTEALEQAEDFARSQPTVADGLVLKADVLTANNRADDAELVLKDIKQRFPESPIGSYRLGAVYQSQKKYDQALAEFETAVQKSNNAHDVLKSLLAVYLDMGQPAKATARIKKVIAENPKNGGAYQLLGALELHESRFAEGIKALNKAMELNPKWLLPYANLGAAYEKQGQTEQAISIYQKALAIAPQDANMKFNLARVYEGSKRFELAIAQYEDVLKTNPKNLLAVNNVASILSTFGDDAKLKRAAQMAKQLEGSDEPAFLDTLAWIYHLSGDSEKARPLQIKAVEKSPQVPIFNYHLGMIYAKLGDRAKAKEHLEKALESKSEFPGAAEAKTALQGL